MSEKPGYLTTLDYSGRWGIEPMFSDFKSRGFGVENMRVQYPDRLPFARHSNPLRVPEPLASFARLLLVMALALYSAVSPGQWDEAHRPIPAEKVLNRQPAKVARSKLSWFTRGLRRVAKLMQALLPLPPALENMETDTWSGERTLPAISTTVARIKRQSYGRAGLELLRRRMVPVARSTKSEEKPRSRGNLSKGLAGLAPRNGPLARIRCCW